jgi:ABC-2 type transport system permease protein
MAPTAKATGAIASKDLLRRIRDRSAILIAVVLPFALAVIFSLTLGGADQASFTATFAIADLDGGRLPASFREAVGALDFVTLRDAVTRREADRLAGDGDVDAAFVFGEGFTSTVEAGQGGAMEVVTSPNADVGAVVARSLASSFAGRLNAVAVSIAVAAPANATPEQIAAIQRAAQEAPAPARIMEGTADAKTFNATTFFAIGMAVFFLFFTVEFGVRGLLEEREQGTLARLLVAPLPPSAILLGKALASFVVGMVATVLLVLASSWLLDATWGAPFGVAVLVVSGVLTAVAVTALVTTLAQTPAQAGSYTSIVAVVGGLLGGTFFPISQAPGILGAIRFLSPQGWLMEGFQRLASGDPASAAIPAAAGTLAIGAVCAVIAWSRASRLVAR